MFCNFNINIICIDGDFFNIIILHVYHKKTELKQMCCFLSCFYTKIKPENDQKLTDTTPEKNDGYTKSCLFLKLRRVLFPYMFVSVIYMIHID